jgi:flagellar biosynthesis/type III secretory pathway chaperone
MWQELIQILDKLQQQYENLLVLSKKKRGILVQVNWKALDAILQEENSMVAEISASEKERKSVLKKLAQTHAVLQPDAKMTDLYAFCPKAEADQLKTRHARLNHIVQAVMEASDANKMLISGALAAVNYQLNVLGTTTVQPAYGATGCDQVFKIKKFDFKA